MAATLDPPPAFNSFSVGGAATFMSPYQKETLEATAMAIAISGKGIAGCDESAPLLGQGLTAVGLENTVEIRRAFRQVLLETPGCEEYLSAAVLDPETLNQRSHPSGMLFPESLASRGMVPGVNVHLKMYPLPGCHGDTVVQGLDSLSERCAEYYMRGARFASWRSAFGMDGNRPTDLAIHANVNDLARYALICQSEGLVPIVEVSLSLQGSYRLDEAVIVNMKILSKLFAALLDHNVYLPGCILKTNMVLPGLDCKENYSVDEIAQATIFVLQQTVPVAVPSIHFLSGGQSFEQATARLSAINQAKQKSPWNLSFSWSQALQEPLLQLCEKEKGPKWDAMSALYFEELVMASDAALGMHEGTEGDGDHETPSKKQRISG